MEMSLAVMAELFSLSSEQGQCLGDPFWAWARKAPTLSRRKVQFECLARKRIILHAALKKAACGMVG